MTSTRKRSPDDGQPLTRGYYARCENCGEIVVHSNDGVPFHMHRNSKKCREAGKRKEKA